MTKIPNHPPSRHVLRQLLERFARTLADLEQLLIDHLPEVLRTVPRTSLQAALNGVLEKNIDGQLWDLLCQLHPEFIASNSELWNNAESSLHAASHEQAQLRKQLLELRTAQKVLAEHPGGREQLDAKIRDLEAQARRPRELRSAQVLGDRYELVRRLGKGAMAEVWLAQDRGPAGSTATAGPVALKVLHQNLHLGTEREYFRRGAQLMRELRHPHIVRVLGEPQESDGRLYFAMEYLAGGTLRDKVMARELTEDVLLRSFQNIVAALQYAHEARLEVDGMPTQCKAHRDISPKNILFDGNGKIYLSDFDMACLHNFSASDGRKALGAMRYAAPERIEQAQEADKDKDQEGVKSPDRRADVFSLALVMLFSLSRKEVKVDERKTQIETLISQLPQNTKVKAVLKKALQDKPELRYGSAEEFGLALTRAFSANRFALACRRYAVIACAPILGLAGTGALHWRSPEVGRAALGWGRSTLARLSAHHWTLPGPWSTSSPPGPSPSPPAASPAAPPGVPAALLPPDPVPAQPPEQPTGGPELAAGLSSEWQPLPLPEPAAGGILTALTDLASTGPGKRPRFWSVFSELQQDAATLAWQAEARRGDIVGAMQRLSRIFDSDAPPSAKPVPPQSPPGNGRARASAGGQSGPRQVMSRAEQLKRNNENIALSAAQMPLCDCICAWPDTQTQWPRRSPEISAVFTLEEQESRLKLHVPPGDLAYNLSPACVNDLIDHYIPSARAPHDPVQFNVQKICAGAVTPQWRCVKQG